MQSIAPLLAAAKTFPSAQKNKAPHLTVSATVLQMACLLQNIITGRSKNQMHRP
jgi:hypothetical protein